MLTESLYHVSKFNKLWLSRSYGDQEKLLNLVKGLLDKDFPVPCSLFPVPSPHHKTYSADPI
ncbi:hypothetical protein [Coleofasciculus sp. E1-EBD-02]|jgi:hypothetical protein|uniref:hypothetical protein n=1 Tax=Coleofasciculus sp. E1-EBD-02 TaxID=3068481 RepID=UPI0032F65AEB